MAQPTRPTGPPKPRVPMLLMPMWDIASRAFLLVAVLSVAGLLVAPGARGWLCALLLAAVLFRTGWGLVGSEASRFQSFGQLGDVGHDAAGGMAVAAWLLGLGALALTGLHTAWLVAHGPLLYAAAGAGLAHLAVRAALHRQDLADDLLRGRRRLPANLRQPRFAHPALAIGVALAAAAVAGLAAWVL